MATSGDATTSVADDNIRLVAKRSRTGYGSTSSVTSNEEGFVVSELSIVVVIPILVYNFVHLEGFH